MSLQEYKFIQFRAKSRARIETCNAIIAEYQAAGLRMTLRQLYYQLVSRNVIKNTFREYKNLGNLVSDARLAGITDWDAIEDRVRPPIEWPEYQDLQALVDDLPNLYRRPRWDGQENYVELWVEKSALAGVLAPLASKYHVTMMVNRGYSSSTAMYEAAQRYLYNCSGDARDDYSTPAKNPVLFYLGDHDPSGEDMVRDVEARMQMFGVHDIKVQKLALTMHQVRQYKPPNNPVKIKDGRAKKYIEENGPWCWEVDALNPTLLTDLITRAFESVVDTKKMDKIIQQEQRDIRAVTSSLPDILKRLRGAGETK